MLGVGREERQTSAGDEVTDQRRYEDGLAGARKARHAEAHRWRQVIREACLRVFEKIGISNVSQVMPRMSQEKGGRKAPFKWRNLLIPTRRFGCVRSKRGDLSVKDDGNARGQHNDGHQHDGTRTNKFGHGISPLPSPPTM
jgi:hypothetical protein